MIKSANKTGLILLHGLWYKAGDAVARRTLLSLVFGDIPRDCDLNPRWQAHGLHDGSGHHVVSIDTALLDLHHDGINSRVGAIRLVAVHPDWRGRGLFRELMKPALEWCDARSSGSTLLYAEDAGLYERFGFRPVAQHAFIGAAPRPLGRLAGRPIALPADAALIRRCLATRSAVSDRCAIVGAPALFLEALAKDDSIMLAYIEDLEALVAYETEAATIVLVDVVAVTVPSLGSILGALGGAFDTVRTLFPPDKLDWASHPVSDDTGLMIRGELTAALTHPFMLPPTAEF